MISFIVSVYDRAKSLSACLASLAVQDCVADVTVCCNTTELVRILGCENACRNGEKLIRTGALGASSCYESAGMVAPHVKGKWLCFPSDDSLYVQGFSRIMLQAAERTAADLVYCDTLYHRPDEPTWEPYSILETSPRMGRIDKSSFIIRRELFKGFPPHPKGWSDGALIEDLLKLGVRHAKAPGILVVHQ